MIHEREHEIINIIINRDMRDVGTVFFSLLDDFLVTVCHHVLDFIGATGQNIIDALVAIRLADVVLDRLVDVLLVIVLGHVSFFQSRPSRRTAIC
jgi:hypothetical protein